jgi:hypothetical protein
MIPVSKKNALIVILIIISIFLLSAHHNSIYEKYIGGFWIADDEFCKDSKIDSMMIFIDESKKSLFKQKRICHIVILDDLCNQEFEMTYNRWRLPHCIGDEYEFKFDAEFDDEKIWEGPLKLSLNINKGTIIIKNNEKIYASLFKQHDITNIIADSEV